MKKIKNWTLTGVILNLIPVVIAISLIGTVVVYSVMLENATTMFFTNATNVDPDSIVAGYEVIGNLFMSLGSGMAWLGMVLIGIFIAAYGIVSFIPMILGVIWLLQYKKNKLNTNLGKGNVIARLVFNVVIFLFFAWACCEDFSMLFISLALYELFICFTHYKCLEEMKK